MWRGPCTSAGPPIDVRWVVKIACVLKAASSSWRFTAGTTSVIVTTCRSGIDSSVTLTSEPISVTARRISAPAKSRVCPPFSTCRSGCPLMLVVAYVIRVEYAPNSKVLGSRG